MAVVNKVTSTLFLHLKSELEYVDPITVAMANHLSLKTILMVKGSANYQDYLDQKSAQHPKSTKPPLAARLDIIELQLKEILTLLREPRLL
jgi:hypothetical protein